MYVSCETQAEVDDLWATLTEGGEESQKAGRAMNAMLKMKKIDIAALERAAGPPS